MLGQNQTCYKPNDSKNQNRVENKSPIISIQGNRINPKDWQNAFLSWRLKPGRVYSSGYMVNSSFQWAAKNTGFQVHVKDKLVRWGVWGNGWEAATIPAFTYLNRNLSYVPCTASLLVQNKSNWEQPQVQILTLSALAQTLQQTLPVPNSMP